MKPEHSFPEIGDLLRSHKPDASPPPGLEARILHAVECRTRPAPKHRVWPWFVLPPAFAAIFLILQPHSPAPATGVSRSEPLPALEPVVSIPDAAEPLAMETRALSRDVGRAGSFLIDCLPSIARQNE